jgi:hypothetical protein
VYIVSSLDAPPVDSRFGLYVGRDVTIPVTVSVVGASQIQGTDGELGSSTTLLPGADYEWVFYHEDSAALWGLVSDTAGIAKRIAVSGGYVDVAAAAPPNPGDVLTAIDAENAEWAPPSGGSGWLTFTTDFDPADGQWIIAANATSNFLPAATAPGMHVAVYVPIGYTDVNIKCVANAFQIDRKTYDAGGQVEVRPGAWYEWVSVDFGSDIRWVPVGGSGTSARPPLEYAAPPYPDTPGALNNKWLLGSDNTALELPIQLMHGDSIAIFADVTCTVRPGNSTFLEAPDLSATVAWPTYITLAAGTYYEWIYTDTDNTWHPRQNMLPRIAVGSTFAWSANAATIAVSGIATWAASNTMTGNCTLTLSGGVDGVRGSFYVKQDAVGSRTLTLTVSGRTILRDTGVTDDNPSAGANTITAYEYEFVTIAGTASVRIRKMPLV